MTYQPYLIAPWDSPQSGLFSYYKPWLIGNDAFPLIEDAYIWRGAVRKREGYKLLGTLPTTPVQGLRTQLITSTGDINLIGFSATKAYRFNNGTQVFDDISGATVWTGGNTNFFWSDNFQGSIWTTNNVDPIRTYFTGTAWVNQIPIVNGAITMTRALIVIAYKGRMVALNTTENGVNFYNRARWAQIGTDYVAGTSGVDIPTPFVADVAAWRDDIPGRGGFNDADTSERIISAAIINDVLIVFFQRSTWRLRYTGNEVLPFLWERINTQYGSESTFSTVPFDDAALSFSRFGFIGSNTNSVARIDEKIPDQSFFNMEFGTTLANLQFVQGIRDFYRQTAYWCYENINDSPAGVNNRVLAYNYLQKSWAIFKQPFRCFGYYNTFNDTTWALSTFTWESANFPWIGVTQATFPQVVAGDANINSGNVYIVYDLTSDAQDQPSFNITAITSTNPAIVTTAVPSGFITGQSVLFNNVTGTMAGVLNGNSFVVTVLTANTFSIPVNTIGLTFTGIGTVTGIVNFDFNIMTKNFTPYIELGSRAKLAYVDLYTSPTEGGEITVFHYVDDIPTPILQKTVNISTLNNSKYTRIFLGGIGRVHQLQFTLTPAQVADPQKGLVQFEMQGAVLWFSKQGRIKN